MLLSCSTTRQSVDAQSTNPSIESSTRFIDVADLLLIENNTTLNNREKAEELYALGETERLFTFLRSIQTNQDQFQQHVLYTQNRWNRFKKRHQNTSRPLTENALIEENRIQLAIFELLIKQVKTE